MLEIEVKLIGLDQEAFRKKLLEKGASFDIEENQTNIRINSASHPIPDSSYLRLRKIQVQGREDQIELTFKARLQSEGARKNEETTSLVQDGEAILKILSLLGFDRQITARKNRIRYLYKNFRVEFDCWDKNTLSYPYIEVEAPSVEALDDFIKEFDIDPEKVSTKSIAELTREDWEKRKAEKRP